MSLPHTRSVSFRLLHSVSSLAASQLLGEVSTHPVAALVGVGARPWRGGAHLASWVLFSAWCWMGSLPGAGWG